jgi:hypothetical protein
VQKFCHKKPRDVSEKASPPYYLQPTQLSKKQSKKQPEKAPSESRNFPPRKSRNKKISEKNQPKNSQRQTKPRLHGEFFLKK